MSALHQFNVLISGPNYGSSSVCEVCVCVCTHMWLCVLVCLGFHFGQCTNPICMSLILDDVQALGSVCVMERMPVCQVEVRQGTGPRPGEKSSCFAHSSQLRH